jgi:O-antigen/teichoic acid export membrane protein
VVNDRPDREETGAKTPPLSRTLIRGSAWTVAMRWSIRAIGVVSTLILARLLDPQDFGLVAIAALLIGLADTVFALGVDLALIQNKGATREDFDTAWTIQLVQGLMVGSVLAVAAPLAARYVSEPRVELVTWILAAGYVVQSAQNIGVVAFRRDLDFARDYRFMVSRKILTFVITVAVAWWYRSYWALVAGMVAGNVIGTALSFLMHPYRPRLSLARWSKLWSFSQWLLIRNIGTYAHARVDAFIVGGIAGTRSMGLYSVASEISLLTSSELVAPLDRALFPGYALIQHQPERLRAAYRKVLQVIALIALPLGLGLAATAHNAVRVMLGVKWTEVVPLIAILSLSGIPMSLRYTASSVLMAAGGVRAVAFIPWINLLLFVASALPAAHFLGVMGIAYARLGVAILTAPVVFSLMIARTAITWSDVVSSLWRPTAAGAAMYGVLALLPDDIGGTATVSLVVEVVLGAVAYGAMMTLLWIASGRPDGAERWLFDLIRRRRPRLL